MKWKAFMSSLVCDNRGGLESLGLSVHLSVVGQAHDNHKKHKIQVLLESYVYNLSFLVGRRPKILCLSKVQESIQKVFTIYFWITP